LPILLQVPHFQALTHTSMILLHIPAGAVRESTLGHARLRGSVALPNPAW
jgi:hypothetical protein